MKTVHYAAGEIWNPLVVGQEIKPPAYWECVDCRKLEADGWFGVEVDCEPPDGPGRIVTVYGEEATRAGSVCVRWFGPRGTVGSILATYRFDSRLA